MMIIDAVPLQLSDEQKIAISDYFIGQIDAACRDRGKMEQQWVDAVKQYNGRMERPDRGPYDADIDIPVTREYSQQSISRLVNPLFQQDRVFTCVPRPGTPEEVARGLEDALDWMTDICDFRKLVATIVRNAHIYHYVVVKTNMVTRSRKIKEWAEVEEPVLDENGEQEYAVVPDTTGPPGSIMRVPVTRTVKKPVARDVITPPRAIPEVVPTPDFIFPSSARDVETAAWVDHQFWLNRGELKQRARTYGYAVDFDKLARPSASKPSYYSEEAETIGIDVSGAKLYRCHEIYTTIGEIRLALEDGKLENSAFPGLDDSEEVILTIEHDSKLVLRSIMNPFYEYPRPFNVWAWERRPEGIPGVSLAYLLAPIQRAHSAMFNQELDAQTKANNTIIFGLQGTGLSKAFKNGVLKGGFYELNSVSDVGASVAQFQLSQPRTTSPQMRAELREHGLMLSSVNQYNFGNEQIARPTASGQIALIDEGKQPLYEKLEDLRSVMADIARVMIARYRQWYPDGFPYYVRVENPDGSVAYEERRVEWPGGAVDEEVFIETKASSASVNKSLRRQEKLAMLDKIPQVYMTMSQMYAQALTPSPMSGIMFRLARAYQMIVDDFLTEFDVDEKEAINPDLSKEVNLGAMVQQLLGQVQALSQENAMLRSSVQGGPPPRPGKAGGPPGPPGMGPLPQMAGPPAGPPPPGPPPGPIPGNGSGGPGI